MDAWKKRYWQGRFPEASAAEPVRQGEGVIYHYRQKLKHVYAELRALKVPPRSLEEYALVLDIKQCPQLLTDADFPEGHPRSEFPQCGQPIRRVSMSGGTTFVQCQPVCDNEDWCITLHPCGHTACKGSNAYPAFVQAFEDAYGLT
jgi:hypothetical protein